MESPREIHYFVYKVVNWSSQDSVERTRTEYFEERLTNIRSQWLVRPALANCVNRCWILTSVVHAQVGNVLLCRPVAKGGLSLIHI